MTTQDSIQAYLNVNMRMHTYNFAKAEKTVCDVFVILMLSSGVHILWKLYKFLP